MALEIRRLCDNLGAEIMGVDLSAGISDDLIVEIRQCWLQHKIVLFRGQNLSPKQQSGFAQNFGTLKVSPGSKTFIPEHPEVIVFSNIKVNGKDIGARPDRSFGDAWHSDFSFIPEPAGGSLFYAKEVPDGGGDDTWYTNLAKAYAVLPDDTKKMIQNLRWTYSHITTVKRHAHDYKPMTKEQESAFPDVTHPFVRTHPETGEKILFVGILDTRESLVSGMSKRKGVAFLDKLKAYATQAQFTYTHKWLPGDAILWDNRSTMHRGSIFPDTNGPRLCYRVTLEGGIPY